jgi:hypothetical protein
VQKVVEEAPMFLRRQRFEEAEGSTFIRVSEYVDRVKKKSITERTEKYK